MKKFGIINAQLAGYIAGLGHKDQFMIGDGGMPVPPGVPIVDLALCGGVPTFQQVMDAVLKEAEVEFYTLAEEIQDYNLSLIHISRFFIVNSHLQTYQLLHSNHFHFEETFKELQEALTPPATR